MWGPKFSFVIFASGKGTNARALMEHAQKNRDKMEVLALISDREGIPALDLAASYGVKTKVILGKDEKLLLEFLEKIRPSWAFLAGYKKILSPRVLHFFQSSEGFFRVLNVHPSLLPAYPGLHGYERAFQDGVKVTGVTVHLVDAGLDTGPIVLQEAMTREESDTLETLQKKGQSVEHKLFVNALELAAHGRIHFQPSPRWVSLGEKK